MYKAGLVKERGKEALDLSLSLSPLMRKQLLRRTKTSYLVCSLDVRTISSYIHGCCILLPFLMMNFLPYNEVP